MDPMLLLASLALGALGVLAVAIAETESSQYYAVNQALGLLVGLVGMVSLALFDYRWIQRHLRPAYGLAIAMLLVVLVAGIEVNGSQSWVALGPIQLQPSEFAKPLTVLALAGFVSESSFADELTLFKTLGIMLVPTLLVLAQPDLGTAMVFGAIFLGIVFVGGARWYQIGGLFAAGAIASFLAIKLHILEDYQLARLTSFLDPGSDPASSYQVANSKMAIGSGGLTGKGIDSSSTLGDLGYLSEDRTDFIFANFAEKVGFVGAMLVLVLLFLLLWRMLSAAAASRDRFGVLVAVGIAAIFTFHVLINVGMVTGIMPVTGLPLPLVSYGRSNLLVSLLSLGLIQSIVVQSKLKSEAGFGDRATPGPAYQRR